MNDIDFKTEQYFLEIIREHNKNFDYGLYLREIRDVLEDFEYLKLHCKRVRKSKNWNIKIFPVMWNHNRLFERIMHYVLYNQTTNNFYTSYESHIFNYFFTV